jgi:hypothetical protein
MIKRTWPTERDGEASSAGLQEKARECQLVDFVSQEGRCHSFPLAQLVHCVLERNPAPQDQTDAPPDRLTLEFSMLDVVILGWNLQGIRDALDLSRPVIVRARDARYAKVEDRQSFVSAIAVRTGEQPQVGDLP